MGNLIRSLLLAVILMGCAKNLPSELEKGLPAGGGNLPLGSHKFLEGTFIDTDGQSIVLDHQISKPTVIIFSQDTCVICRAETQMLVEKFAVQQNIPQNVNLYTLLIGTIIEDVQDYKEALSIPWKVGFQSNDSLFKAYCPELKVPCVVVETPTSGFVFQKTGEFHVEEIETHTGAWTY